MKSQVDTKPKAIPYKKSANQPWNAFSAVETLMQEQSQHQTRRSSNHEPIRIMIVEDHDNVRQSIKSIVSQEPDMVVCDEAAGVSDAMLTLQHTKANMAVVDLSLPDGNGLDLIREIRTRFPRIKVLVLSIYDEQIYAKRVLNAGANGFVSKMENMDIIVEAIRCAHKDRIFVKSPDNITDKDFDVSILSPREQEVFRMLSRDIPHSQIAEKMQIRKKTLSTYRHRIKSKLGISIEELNDYARKYFQAD